MIRLFGPERGTLLRCGAAVIKKQCRMLGHKFQDKNKRLAGGPQLAAFGNCGVLMSRVMAGGPAFRWQNYTSRTYLGCPKFDNVARKGWATRHYTNLKTDLHPDHAHQLLHRVGALLQGGLLFRGQLDLDDLLDAVRAQLAGHANEQAVDTVLAFEIGGARHDLLLVLKDGLNHLRDCGRRRVVSAPGLEVLDDLGAAVAGALHQAREGGCVHQLGDGNARHGRVARQRNHGVAVTAKYEGGDVLDGNVQFPGDESSEARRIENAGHADHAIARKAA